MSPRIVSPSAKADASVVDGFTQYSLLSKSLNDPKVLTALRKQFESATIDLAYEKQMTPSPLKKTEIATVINQQSELKKLYLRQSLKPIERHI